MTTVVSIFAAAFVIVLAVVLIERWTSPTNRNCRRCHAPVNFLTKGGICQQCAEEAEG